MLNVIIALTAFVACFFLSLLLMFPPTWGIAREMFPGSEAYETFGRVLFLPVVMLEILLAIAFGVMGSRRFMHWLRGSS
jgi:hypothetical protein